MSVGRTGGRVIQTFRDAFTFATKDVTQWFPGHMNKGMKQMQSKLKHVDCIIEVQDARIPFTGRNPKFESHLMIRPHLLLLNKVDLADMTRKSEIVAKLKEYGVGNILFANSKRDFDNTIKYKLIPKVMELIKNSPRYHRQESQDYNLLVIGVPNVGKSSFINSMRRMHLKKGKATRVGGVAGVTRSVLEKITVSAYPRMYLLDTPGILSPDVRNVEVGMRLALCSTLQDHLVGPEIIADYMLYWLNKHNRFEYVSHYGLESPTDDIMELLGHIAKSRNYSIKIRSLTQLGLTIRPDLNRTANVVLQDFRNGTFGRIMLDTDYLSQDSET
ncbi:mitochondrial ribosome-associated GTPase 1-like [Tubulanus polymorphus]|uniref:mitochondrial ribosome-associated GTPase 1-like n=1 Tax=Tubulanus polymorphus TaxID=672921 RepID=UPI003DA392A8